MNAQRFIAELFYSIRHGKNHNGKTIDTDRTAYSRTKGKDGGTGGQDKGRGCSCGLGRSGKGQQEGKRPLSFCKGFLQPHRAGSQVCRESEGRKGTKERIAIFLPLFIFYIDMLDTYPYYALYNLYYLCHIPTIQSFIAKEMYR